MIALSAACVFHSLLSVSTTNYFGVCGTPSPGLRDPDISPPAHGFRGSCAGGGDSLTSPEGAATLGNAAVACGERPKLICIATCKGHLLPHDMHALAGGSLLLLRATSPGTPGVKMDQGVIRGAERRHVACPHVWIAISV